MAKIKICGLKRIEDIKYVNEYKPDYIGFVFANTRRKVTYETARRLKDELDGDIQAVGVFVNEDMEHIVSLVKNRIIDVVQLHGDETDEFITELKKQVTCDVIKAVRVKSMNDILERADCPADYLLLDTFVKKSIYGGTGKSFDRKLIPKINKPYFLAGGLDSSNVMDAITECNPYCVDLSSSVETDGFKDKEKIKNIIDTVRKGDSLRELVTKGRITI